MSSESDAPRSEGGDKAERMDRLRALLTKPIRIPESASTDGTDADYAAPVADAAAPKGAKTPMTPQTPKKPKAPVETPPAVKAAAEALDRLTDADQQADEEPAASGRPSKARRTWADAYLAKPDKSLTPEEVNASLTVALKEQGAELRELLTKQAAAHEKALGQAGERAEATAAATTTDLSTRFEERFTTVESGTEQVATDARAQADRLQGRIDELAATTETLRTTTDTLRADLATTGEQLDAATKKAGSATTFAWVGIALAVVAAVLAVVM